MAGEFDVYQICPCGSGKKIKFCCQAIIAEMLKVSELQESSPVPVCRDAARFRREKGAAEGRVEPGVGQDDQGLPVVFAGESSMGPASWWARCWPNCRNTRWRWQ